ncbi:MAG TPA: Rieske (2Fe-2S) protein [Polyangiaceae bacterium]|jgi:nitrite reductase/ring-hydroxylating ferredoxin subunit
MLRARATSPHVVPGFPRRHTIANYGAACMVTWCRLPATAEPVKVTAMLRSLHGRRELMKGVAAVCALGACGPPFGVVAAGNASALAVGQIKVVPGSPVAIARDAQGVYAMTLVCTHEGCDISTEGSVSASGIVCGCHGSRFDVDGNVIVGPASSPLQHYQVTADASGDLTIDGNTPVPEATRLVV